MNKKTVALKLLKNRQVRRIGVKLLKDPRVQRVLLKQVSRRLRGR